MSLSLITAFLPNIICGSTLLAGRLSRVFLKKNPIKRCQYLKIKVLASGLGLTTLLEYSCYNNNIVPCPITGKNKFVALSTDMLTNMSNQTMKYGIEPVIQEKESEISQIHHQVMDILDRLVKTNLELPNINNHNWRVTIVNKPYGINAFSLPSGQIILLRGEVDLSSSIFGDLNESSLAYVLSHEMAHVMLDHANQNWTRATFIQFCLWFPMVFIWAFIPSLLMAFGVNLLLHTLVNVTISRPWMRKIEIEADMLGIDIMARGCFDITEAPRYYSKLIIIKRFQTADNIISYEQIMKYLSTHPPLETRRKLLLDKIEHDYNKSKCNGIRYEK